MKVTFGDFAFDTSAKVLARRGTAVALTPKAASLLDALIAAAPDAVTKEKLYDLLWASTFVESGNLHNLISEVRGAIGDDDHNVIRTVHRVGYAFAAPLTRLQSAAPRTSLIRL
jgi:DNA-binding winged helix-turn-helix (wHTH) protein